MYILFDIGGTKTRVALSRDGKGFDEPVIRSTPRDWNEAAVMIDEVFGSVAKGEKIRAVVGGLPGVLDDERSTISRAPNLPDWAGKPIRERISKAAGCEARLYNDTTLCALGEAHFGAGKGYEIVTYMTVSTGVGGTRIVNGDVDEFRYGFEPGHQIIDFDEFITLEDAVSGTSFIKKWGADFVHQAPESAWQEAARKLAVGIHNTVVHWSPDVVVLGGSMIVKPIGIPVAVVFENLKRILSIFPKIPEIKSASLADKGGLYGALVEVNRLFEGKQ